MFAHLNPASRCAISLARKRGRPASRFGWVLRGRPPLPPPCHRDAQRQTAIIRGTRPRRAGQEPRCGSSPDGWTVCLWPEIRPGRSAQDHYMVDQAQLDSNTRGTHSADQNREISKCGNTSAMSAGPRSAHSMHTAVGYMTSHRMRTLGCLRLRTCGAMHSSGSRLHGLPSRRSEGGMAIRGQDLVQTTCDPLRAGTPATPIARLSCGLLDISLTIASALR